MKIPTEAVARNTFFDELIKKCTHSQNTRKQQYEAMRSYYLFGCEDGGQSPFNKVYPHIDLLTSFLFASETTKFTVALGASAKEVEHHRVQILGRSINDKWLESNADNVVSNCITWALVFNTMLIKLNHRVNEKDKTVDIHPFPVHPGSFGVLREDITFLDRQEAMVHTYHTTYSQLEIDLKGHPHKASILEGLQTSTSSIEGENDSGGIARLMVSSTHNPLSGTAGEVDLDFRANMDYLPDVKEETVCLHEVWVWDTDNEDYHVVTKIMDGAIIFDRANFFLKGEHPFVKITPLPMPFYYWGMSEVMGLSRLQDWRNDRIAQIQKLLNLQVKPPTSATGMGIVEEKMYALFCEGGIMSPADPMSQGKIDRFAPAIPSDIYNVVNEIDQMFSEHSGLPNTVQGKGDTGVRSGKQASELARLGSARIKKRSLVVEDSLEKLATLYLKIMQKYDCTEYADEKGSPFIANQFTSDYVVKVDAHSNSPIFIEDKKELAFSMLQAHMITRERAIDMLDAPDKEILKREVREIEKKEQEAQQQKQQAEAQAMQQKEAAKNQA